MTAAGSPPLHAASGLRVADLAVGMAPALVVRMLLDAGARVDTIVPAGGNPFHSVYPAYRGWKDGTVVRPAASRDELLAQADICIVGGEDFSGLTRPHDAAEIAATYPRLIVVEITALGRHAQDLLVQSDIGLVNEQSTARPICVAAGLPTYGAALAAMVGLWAAVIDRERTGRGQQVTATLEQGAMLFWSQVWMEAERPSAEFEKLPPRDVTHLIFRCADGGYVQLVLGVSNALARLYAVLGIAGPVDQDDRGVPRLDRGPANYFADRAPLEASIARWQRDALLAALADAGIAAEPVLAPGEAWDDPQVRHCELVRTNPNGSQQAGSPFVMRSLPGASRALPDARSPAPLSGFRVVDLGNFIAGPAASKLLADLGADVIKVEPPVGLGNLTGLRNTWACNRGKRSIVADLKSADGQAVVRALCADADVVHHNFRPGVAERLGVDPASLRVFNPNVVTLQTSAYGSTGPKAARPGWDMVMQALLGMEYRAGGVGNPPMWYRSAIVDYATGALGAIAMLMGLFHRTRHGGAVETETSLLATAMFLSSELVKNSDGSVSGAPPLDQGRNGFHPAERLYRVRDGWIALVARGDVAAKALATTLGLSLPGPRSAWSDSEAAQLEAALLLLSVDAVAALFDGTDVWVTPCATDAWQRLKAMPELWERGTIIEVEDRRFGRITGSFGVPVHLSRSCLSAPPVSAPASDEHRAEILAGLRRG